MFLQISFLTKAFVALSALERFNSAVKPDMIFNVTTLIERLATSIYQTFDAQIKFRCFGIIDSGYLIEFFGNAIERMGFDI